MPLDVPGCTRATLFVRLVGVVSGKPYGSLLYNRITNSVGIDC